MQRTGGAGPSDDGHLMVDGLHAAIPRNPQSPFVFDGDRVLYDGVDIGVEVSAIGRPRFYDLQTADGVSYEKIARLQHVVQITVVTGVIVLAVAMTLILLLNLTWSLDF